MKTSRKLLALFAASLLSVGALGACGGSGSTFKTVDAPEFAEGIKSNNPVVVDVRTPEEFAEGHLPGALNIDFKSDDFLSSAESALEKKRTVYVYCRSGRRSAAAASLLAEKGFSLVNLDSGIIDWQKRGFPVTIAPED